MKVPQRAATLSAQAVADPSPWGLWGCHWQPLRHRWIVTVSPVRPWTDEELAAEPTLAMAIRPRGIFFGTHMMAVEVGGQLPVPFMDVPRSSPFWTREAGCRTISR